MINQFAFAFLSTVGFCILFNIPKKAIIKASLVGGIGWIFFFYFKEVFHSAAIASFIGSCVVAIISEVFARKFKETVTVFVIPGIIPLVPGAGMYNTMLAIIKKDFTHFSLIGTETLFIAGGISSAILIVSSLTKMFITARSSLNNYRDFKKSL